MTSFLTELRRRNIFRVAGVYAVIGWLKANIDLALEREDTRDIIAAHLAAKR